MSTTRRKRILVPVVFLLCTACSSDRAVRGPTDEDVVASVCAVLDAQSDAWNAGDMDGYLRGHWNDPRARHIGNDELTVGYDAIAARFRRRYPNPQQMGSLAFSDLEIDVLAPDMALACARWRYARDDLAVSGIFTLLFRKIDGDWVIVHDHTSTAPMS